MKRQIDLTCFMDGLSAISNDNLIHLLVENYKHTEKRSIQAVQYLCLIAEITTDPTLRKLILVTCNFDQSFLTSIIKSSVWSNIQGLELLDKRDATAKFLV